jgi:glutaredoxin-like protein
MPEETIKIYGADWCPDCRRSKAFLEEHQVAYEWIDVDQDGEAQTYVRRVNNGRRIIPTILFPDGSILVEPGNAELAKKLELLDKTRRF